MNAQLKTVLLTVLTLSFFVIALVELSGVSKTAILNKYDPAAAAKPHQAKAASQANDLPKTTMKFEEDHFSFGSITEGEKARHAFKFHNTGDQPLVIADAKASCGCTVPSFPKEPIPPGGDGEIIVEFNSAGRPGHQQKNVMIYSNAQLAAMPIGFDVDVKEKQAKN